MNSYLRMDQNDHLLLRSFAKEIRAILAENEGTIKRYAPFEKSSHPSDTSTVPRGKPEAQDPKIRQPWKRKTAATGAHSASYPFTAGYRLRKSASA